MKQIAELHELQSMFEYIQYLGFLTVAIVCFTWALLIAIFILIVGKMFGGELREFRLFGFSIVKNRGKFTIQKKPFMPIPICEMMGRVYESRSRWLAYQGVVMGIMVIIGIVTMFFVFSYEYSGGYVGEYVKWSMMFICIFIVVHILLFVSYVRPLSSDKVQQQAFMVKEIVRQVNGGIRPKNIKTSLDEKVPIDSPAHLSFMSYILIRYYRAIENHDIEEIKKAASIMVSGLGQGAAAQSYAMFYAELLFFYSSFNLDEETARLYFKACPERPENDMDMNGRRIYAYYLYNIEGNAERALQVIQEGLDVAEDFPMKGLVPMEKELLFLLKNIIYQDMADQRGANCSRST